MSGADVDGVVGLDDSAQLGVTKLAAVVVNDARSGLRCNWPARPLAQRKWRLRKDLLTPVPKPPGNGDFPFVHEVARHHAGVRWRHFQWVGVTRGRADGEAASSYVDLGQDRQANQKAAGPTHTLRRGATAHGEPAA